MCDQERELEKLTKEWLDLKMTVDGAPNEKEKSRIAIDGISKFSNHEIGVIMKQVLLHIL